MNSHRFKLNRSYSISLNLANVGEIFSGWIRKDPYLSLEEGKDKFCVVFIYSIKQTCEIRTFHVAGVQRRQTNVQNSVMHVQICCFVNKSYYFFAVLLPSPLSLVLLSSRNSATMVTWRHTSPLYYDELEDLEGLEPYRANIVYPRHFCLEN